MEKDSDNLINLSEEENSQTKTNTNNNKLPKFFPLIAPLEEESPLNGLDNNNPFDLVQKLSLYRHDDPFDVVEKEASIKALQSFSSTSTDVKVANLLSLSSDNDFDGAHGSVFSNYTIYESAEGHYLENESPPITLSTKLTPDSLTPDSGGGLSYDSSDSSSKQSNPNLRNRKAKSCRNRLLKISLSNSTYSTPMSSRKFVDVDNVSHSLIRSMDDKIEELAMLASESPLKSMYEEPLETNYTEKDFDADLEMMRIPMLNQVKPLPPSADNISKHPAVQLSNAMDKQDVSSKKEDSTVGPLPDLESIRCKLRAKRLENHHNDQDIQDLIKNLKNLICESNIVDEQKKSRVNGLLETLSSTLTTTTATPNEQEPPTVPPVTITRQATFNWDFIDTNEQPTNQNQEGEAFEEVTWNSNAPLQPRPIEEVPDAMLKSSATYDGENTEDKEYLNLPQIDEPPPPPSNEHFVHPNLNDIMEQLQHLLDQHNFGPSKESENPKNSLQVPNLNGMVGNNPTFIVVMPTTTRSSDEGDGEGNENFNYMRRRSQSLSIHDKLKIVQLPMKTPAPAEASMPDAYESPPLSAASGGNTSILDSDCSGFKTPARLLSRRNSFSNAIPHTPPLRYGRLNSDKTTHNTPEAIKPTMFGSARRFSVMDTHTESQQTETVRPLNLGIIKPDPKKKVKATTTNVVKSNGPMKATLPVKKIVSNIKAAASLTRSSTLNTSMQLLAKSGHISNTSTPMTDSRSSSGLQVVGKGLSTPNAWSSSGRNVSNLAARHSNISTTPIGKAHLAPPSAAASGLRRRTISEFKAKSPMKTRSSSTLSNNSSTTASKPPSSMRSNILRPMTNSKTSVNTRTSLSNASSFTANRNKENKPH